MAFDSTNFTRVGGAVQDDAHQLWAYKTEDTLATVLGDGYFDERYNQIKTGDKIAVTVVSNLGTPDEAYVDSQSISVAGKSRNLQRAEIDFDFAGGLRSTDFLPDLEKKQEWEWDMRIDEYFSSICRVLTTVAGGPEGLLFRFQGGTNLSISFNGNSNRADYGLLIDDIVGLTLHWHLIWEPDTGAAELTVSGPDYSGFREIVVLGGSPATTTTRLDVNTSGDQGYAGMFKAFLAKEDGVSVVNLPADEGSGNTVTDTINGHEFNAITAIDWTAANQTVITAADTASTEVVFYGTLSSSTINVNTTAPGTALTWNDATEWAGIEHDDGDSTIQFLEGGEYHLWYSVGCIEAGAEAASSRLYWLVELHHDTSSDVTIFDYHSGNFYNRGDGFPGSICAGFLKLIVNPGDKLTLNALRSYSDTDALYQYADTDSDHSYLRILKVNR